MKNLRQLCAACVLALTFSLPAFAGVMSTTVAPPPPPAETTLAGDMSTTVATAGNEEASVIDSATEAALNVLQSVLSLL